jgi:hypothetical protein
MDGVATTVTFTGEPKIEQRAEPVAILSTAEQKWQFYEHVCIQTGGARRMININIGVVLLLGFGYYQRHRQ